MLNRLLFLAFVAVVLPFANGMAVVHAVGGCTGGTKPVSTTAGMVCVVVHDPGHSGSQATPITDSSHAGHHESAGCFKTNGEQVPCATDLGVWFGGRQCYASPYDA